MALQPEPEPLQIPHIDGKLVPWLKLHMRLIRIHVDIALKSPYQRQRVLKGESILLLCHLEKYGNVDLVEIVCR